MATITISLPDQIAKKVASEAKNQGFATRSECVRRLIRKYFVGESSDKLAFQEFHPKSQKSIRTKFEKTGKYNKDFLMI